MSARVYRKWMREVLDTCVVVLLSVERVAKEDEVQGLQRGMKVQCDRHEDLSEWAERAIANETEELRRDVRR